MVVREDGRLSVYFPPHRGKVNSKPLHRCNGSELERAAGVTPACFFFRRLFRNPQLSKACEPCTFGRHLLYECVRPVLV